MNPSLVIKNTVAATTRPKSGFTLVEIMIVVLIIGILLTIAFPNFIKARESAQTKACIENLRKIQWAKDQWAMEKGKNSSDTPTVTDLAGSFKYIPYLPVCPTNGQPYTINSIGADPTCTLYNQNPQPHILP